MLRILHGEAAPRRKVDRLRPGSRSVPGYNSGRRLPKNAPALLIRGENALIAPAPVLPPSKICNLPNVDLSHWP